MNTITFHVGDVRDAMAAMPDDTVDLVVTSPPFLALRSYLPADHPDKHREIGSEPTPATFLDTMLGLTAEWRRLVTPTGSLAVEIGDTYSGAGGYGTPDSPNPAYGTARFEERWEGRTAKRFKRKDDGWPEAKSLCLIPELYAVALAYGINPLTGQASPAGRMRVRNWLTWTRPNPPVGALGDKFRPATSFVTVACTSAQRWFDLDAVRGHVSDDRRQATYGGNGAFHDHGNDGIGRQQGPKPVSGGVSNPAGAPPLDWWDEADDWQPLHRLPTQPYAGAHYAAYPIALPRRLIEAMCPRQVCTVCGEARRRIVRVDGYVDNSGKPALMDMNRSRIVDSKTRQFEPGGQDSSAHRLATTIGWTDCDCYVGRGPVYDPAVKCRPGVVLDPFGGSGTTAIAAALTGRDATLIDLDARNIDLCRQRITETLHIVSEVQNGDTWTWTVRHDLPGLKGEHPAQASLFHEDEVAS